MRNRKYFLDINDLQYKQIRLPWNRWLLRVLLWLAGSVTVAIIYGTVFENIYGSPKERMLNQKIENLRLQYALAGKELDNSYRIIESLRMSDEIRYRPILEMDSIPGSIRNPGFGGVDRFRDLDGFPTSAMMKTTRIRIEELKNMVNVQDESFKTVKEKEAEWERMLEYVPWISPVSVNFKRGDGLKFREIHPVLGTPQWHYGQDFNTPYGTGIYATGAGRIIEAGWSSGGFGNYVVLDHGYYGYRSTYGHLSSIKVSKGEDVKRGDLIGLSGSSGTSSGPHLHYQIDQYGQHKNPLYFFNDDMTEEEYFDMIQKLTSSFKLR
jgi:murein DD-endopeptidase MepM/ murein hydrolase activator NlpD